MAKNFALKLLAQVAEKRGDWHYGAELAESDEARADRLIGVELQRKSLTVADLQARRKGDAFKVRLAAKLRAHTTVTASWDVERLCTGTRGDRTHLLSRHGQGKVPKSTGHLE